ncbi:MAG TPA: hydrogenase maturation nickel metallochaperone HypA [Balneolales bacterium]|nr:hydrogenase maturation nickel metallochaperone HypA [Balneolales bacterium]
MHELSVAQNIIRIARGHLTPDQEPRLQIIRVRIGAFSTIVPELLQSGFEAAKDGTPMSTARLEIMVVPLRIKCNICGYESEIEPVDFACPLCSSTDIEIIAGDELTVVNLEISEN